MVLEHVFTMVFFLELLCKTYLLRCGYFRSGWNVVDCVLVFVAVFDNWILIFFVDDAKMQRYSVLRVMRLFFKLIRLARIMKLARVKEDIVVLLSGIVASAKAMLPIAALLFLSIYAMSVSCVDIIGREDWAAEVEFDNYEFFGSLTKSWLTLFNMCILAEWAEIIRPMAMQKPHLVPIFIAFVFFNAFGIMNVIIGVICQHTSEASDQAQAEKDMASKDYRMSRVHDMATVIDTMLQEGDGAISVQEFEHDIVKAITHELLLPHGFTSCEFHELLDTNGDGIVSASEFVTGMFRLVHGNDFQHTCLNHLHLNQIKKGTERNHKQFQEIRSELCKIAKDTQQIQRQVKAMRSDASMRSDSFEAPISHRVASQRDLDERWQAFGERPSELSSQIRCPTLQVAPFPRTLPQPLPWSSTAMDMQTATMALVPSTQAQEASGCAEDAFGVEPAVLTLPTQRCDAGPPADSGGPQLRRVGDWMGMQLYRNSNVPILQHTELSSESRLDVRLPVCTVSERARAEARWWQMQKAKAMREEATTVSGGVKL